MYLSVLVMRGELWLRRLVSAGESHPAMLAIGEWFLVGRISILCHVESAITASI